MQPSTDYTPFIYFIGAVMTIGSIFFLVCFFKDTEE